MSKHTPGPWFHAGNGDVCAIDAITGKQTDVACSYLRSDNHCDANARLISAAPDLLEALQQLTVTATRYLPEYNENPLIQQAEAALAKAQGGQE